MYTLASAPFVANTTIASSLVNADFNDLVNDANTPRPLTAGGTGGASQIAGWDGLNAKGTDIASAATINLDAVTGPRIDITGTTTITAVTLGNGKWRLARATGVFQITASGSLIVNKNAANYVTSAGDMLLFTAEGGVVSVTTLGSASATLAALGPAIAALAPKATPVAADGLLLTDSANSNAPALLTWANLLAGVAVNYRERLTAARTYYVLTTGSDLNNGLTNTAGGAFATIQKAINVALGLDFNGQTVTIQVGAGTWSANVQINAPAPGQAGPANLVILGNTATPSNCTWSVTSNDCITVNGGAVKVRGFKFVTTTSGWAIQNIGGQVQFDSCEFNACASGHIASRQRGNTFVSGNYSISGAAPVHLWAFLGGVIQSPGATITITGTPAFSTAYVQAQSNGSMELAGNTFSGSATGKRSDASMNGSIQTYGATLPGNVAGTTATGGQVA